MSTPNPNDPGYNCVDPDAPVVAPSRSSSALLWILLLVALIALALWWYSKRADTGAMGVPATTTEQPAVMDEGATASPAAVADKSAQKPAAKPQPTPKPVANAHPRPFAIGQQSGAEISATGAAFRRGRQRQRARRSRCQWRAYRREGGGAQWRAQPRPGPRRHRRRAQVALRTGDAGWQGRRWRRGGAGGIQEPVKAPKPMRCASAS